MDILLNVLTVEPLQLLMVDLVLAVQGVGTMMQIQVLWLIRIYNAGSCTNSYCWGLAWILFIYLVLEEKGQPINSWLSSLNNPE
jgi:hypothetical protein